MGPAPDAGLRLPAAALACLADLGAVLEAQLRLASSTLALSGSGAEPGAGSAAAAAEPVPAAAAIAALVGAVEGFRALLPEGGGPAAVGGRTECAAEPPATSAAHAEGPSDLRIEADAPVQAEVPGIQLCHIWTVSGSPTGALNRERERSFLHSDTLQAFSDTSTDRVGDVQLSGSWSRRIVITPTSQRLFVWDILVILILSWDLLTLPLVAFRFDRLPIKRFADLSTNIIWTVDLPVSVFTGYLDKGKLVMDLRSILKRRLARILFDVLILTSDWSLYFLDMNHSASVVRMGKTLRILRILRLLRLARIFRFAGLLEQVTNMVLSETLHACLNILRLLLSVVLFCHFGACFWFAVGSGEGWVSDWLQAQPDHELELVHAYLVSFRWVFAQFTPAPPPDHTSARSLREEAAVVGVLLAGWLLFMFLLGSVNYYLQAAKKDATNRMKEQALFLSFAGEHKLPLRLYNQILSFLKSRGMAYRTAAVVESDIQCLSELPESVLRELHLAVFVGVLKSHPLFQELADWHPSFVMDVCHLATRTRPLGRGDELFASGTLVARAFFVRRRPRHQARAVLGFQAMRRQLSRMDFIREGSWFCEMALWLEMHADQVTGLPLLHTGRAWAEHACDVVELDAPRFRDIAKRHPNALVGLSKYAALFAAGVQEYGSTPEFWGTEDQCLALVPEVFPSRRPATPGGGARLSLITSLKPLKV